jgi:CRISPR/Cas system-associated exonuclease Cas4 (RecB family)
MTKQTKGHVYSFNKEKHEHHIDGIRVPGTTGILKAEGFIDYKFASPDAMHRGTYVHAACHLINKHDLDFDGLNPQYAGYVEAYLKFWNEHMSGKTITSSEENVYSFQWMFAGILDIIINGDTLIDIKTSKVKASWWKYQTAAYALAWNEMKGKKVIKNRYTQSG